MTRPHVNCAECGVAHMCKENGLPDNGLNKNYSFVFGGHKYTLKYDHDTKTWIHCHPDHYPDLTMWVSTVHPIGSTGFVFKYEDQGFAQESDGPTPKDAAANCEAAVVEQFKHMGEILDYTVDD